MCESSEIEFPQFLMSVTGGMRFLPISEAKAIYALREQIDVSVVGYVLAHSSLMVREITEEERQEISGKVA